MSRLTKRISIGLCVAALVALGSPAEAAGINGKLFANPTWWTDPGSNHEEYDPWGHEWWTDPGPNHKRTCGNECVPGWWTDPGPNH